MRCDLLQQRRAITYQHAFFIAARSLQALCMWVRVCVCVCAIQKRVSGIAPPLHSRSLFIRSCFFSTKTHAAPHEPPPSSQRRPQPRSPRHVQFGAFIVLRNPPAVQQAQWQREQGQHLLLGRGRLVVLHDKVAAVDLVDDVLGVLWC